MRELSLEETILALIAVFCVVIAILWALLYFAPRPVCKTGMVLKIGGCDRDGNCGTQIMLKDGQSFSGRAHLPVEDSIYEVCKHNGE